jgi:hypothetical protein
MSRKNEIAFEIFKATQLPPQERRNALKELAESLTDPEEQAILVDYAIMSQSYLALTSVASGLTDETQVNRLEDIVINDCDPACILNFAEEVPLANIQRLQQIIINTQLLRSIANFAIYVKNANTALLATEFIKLVDINDNYTMGELQYFIERGPISASDFAEIARKQDKNALANILLNNYNEQTE